MTLAHFVYIPGVLLVGIVIGYILGGRAAEVAAGEQDEKGRRRAARRARRDAEEAQSRPEA